MGMLANGDEVQIGNSTGLMTGPNGDTESLTS